MSRVVKCLAVVSAVYVTVFSMSMTVNAKEDKIESGIYANDINLSGMTASEAENAVQTYVDSLADTQITLRAVDNNEIITTASALGLKWGNPEIISEAASLGKDGNIVQCYKVLKDLEHENKVYQIAFDFDKELIRTLIEEQGVQYNQDAIDATLIRVDEEFQITEGQKGIVVDTDASVDALYEYLVSDWDGSACDVDLVIDVIEPRGTAEELARVTDVLGTFTTSFSSSGSNRGGNVSNACRLINGTTLYPGDEFSALEKITPFTEGNGYYQASSYLNGQVVDSLGGGVCQVSTTLYNAVLIAEMDVTQRNNHSMIVTYVDPSADAAIAESSGKDFKFVNSSEYPIYIEGYTTDDKKITFTIYGVETRDSNRQVTYESKVLEKIEPASEVIYTDASLPLGYCSIQSAHIGYRAQLWKVVTVDGVEVSREQINSSSYMNSPRSATVGIATSDPIAYNEIMAAVASGSIDQVKSVANAYKAAQANAAAQAAAAQAAAEAAAWTVPEP
ncbi:MAG: VanW family protein [Lachnospiraceae bacterium]|nr:VanW family protein [Lachnospiraceae bacterium]